LIGTIFIIILVFSWTHLFWVTSHQSPTRLARHPSYLLELMSTTYTHARTQKSELARDSTGLFYFWLPVAWLWLFDSHVPFEPGSIRIMFDRIYQMDTVTLLLEYGDVTYHLLLLAFQRVVGRRRLGHWAAVRNTQDQHHRDVARSPQRWDP
jgi:hypothetical protein